MGLCAEELKMMTDCIVVVARLFLIGILIALFMVWMHGMIKRMANTYRCWIEC